MDFIQILLLLTSNNTCTVINGVPNSLNASVLNGKFNFDVINVDYDFLAKFDKRMRHEKLKLDALNCGIFVTSREKVKHESNLT